MMQAIRHKEILPVTWTQEVDEAARAHALEVYPAEAAGIVERGHYVRLENRSSDPKADVCLDDDDLLRVAGADVFFHSHPDGIGSPSAQDMIYQMQLGIPFVILVVPFIDLFAFGDQLPRAPLIGRGFRHGVHDCYSLIRDWYAEQGATSSKGRATGNGGARGRTSIWKTSRAPASRPSRRARRSDWATSSCSSSITKCRCMAASCRTAA